MVQAQATKSSFSYNEKGLVERLALFYYERNAQHTRARSTAIFAEKRNLRWLFKAAKSHQTTRQTLNPRFELLRQLPINAFLMNEDAFYSQFSRQANR
jgi:hypothetical protein